MNENTKNKKRNQKSIGSRKGKKADELIRVHLTYETHRLGGPSGEYLWAKRISRHTARMMNIPFGESQLTTGDLVRIDNQGEITAVLEHVGRTRALIYADPEQESKEAITKKYARIKSDLQKEGIDLEGMTAGICSISVPTDIDEEKLVILAEGLEARLAQTAVDCVVMKQQSVN